MSKPSKSIKIAEFDKIDVVNIERVSKKIRDAGGKVARHGRSPITKGECYAGAIYANNRIAIYAKVEGDEATFDERLSEIKRKVGEDDAS